MSLSIHLCLAIVRDAATEHRNAELKKDPTVVHPAKFDALNQRAFEAGLLALVKAAEDRTRERITSLLLSEKGRFTVVDALEQTDADGADCIGVTDALVRLIKETM